MHSIDALKCVYDTKNRKWAVEILYAEGEKTYRFDIAGPQEAQTVIEAFNMAVASIFDPASGEIHFISEPHGEDPFADDEDDEGEEGEDEQDSDERERPRRQ